MRAEVRSRCIRCRSVRDTRDGGIYCLRCGTAMTDRYCLPCGLPLFGPELLHPGSLLVGGPRVLPHV